MCQIQNSCLNKNALLEPIALIGLAFLAGSTRAHSVPPWSLKRGALNDCRSGLIDFLHLRSHT